MGTGPYGGITYISLLSVDFGELGTKVLGLLSADGLGWSSKEIVDGRSFRGLDSTFVERSSIFVDNLKVYTFSLVDNLENFLLRAV